MGSPRPKRDNRAIIPSTIGVGSLNIASSRLDQLAERLALLTGENVETALERAIEEKLARIETAPSAIRQTALQDFFDRVSRMPVLDERSDDEIIGYDSSGLPS